MVDPNTGETQTGRTQGQSGLRGELQAIVAERLLKLCLQLRDREQPGSHHEH